MRLYRTMPRMFTQSHALSRIEGSLAAIGFLRDQIDVVTALCTTVSQTLQRGGTIYTAGNGGSAAEALHLSEELIGRYRDHRPAIRGVCLNADSTVLTCIANDFGFEHVFSRQCEALLTPSDALVVLSTSGNSSNIINALKAAKDSRAVTIGLLGKTGGQCLEHCDYAIVVPGGDSAHIQEAHQVLIHLICEAVELTTVNAPTEN